MFSEFYFFFYHGKQDINPAASPDAKPNFESVGEDRNDIDGFSNFEESSVKKIFFDLYERKKNTLLLYVLENLLYIILVELFFYLLILLESENSNFLRNRRFRNDSKIDLL